MDKAYIETEKEQLTLFPYSETHKYNLRENADASHLSSLQTGMYQVEVGTYHVPGRDTTMFYLEEAVPYAPDSTELLFDVIRLITGHGDKIVARFSSDESPESVFERITNTSWLEEVRGIGPKTSPSLAEKFAKFLPENFNVFEVFNLYGLPYRPGNQIPTWCNVYFDMHPDELEQFRNNPYHILKIANTDHAPVRKTASSYSDLTPRTFKLEDVENALRHKGLWDRWQDSTERAVYYAEHAIRRGFQTGHTVLTPWQIKIQLEEMGIDMLEGEPVSTDHVESLCKQNPTVEEVFYIDVDNNENSTGYTTKRQSMIARTIAGKIKYLAQIPVPYSDALRDEMIRRAASAQEFDLDDTQYAAVVHAFSNCVSAVTGPAGSGKTTVLQSILSGFSKLLEERATVYPRAFRIEDMYDEEIKTAFNIYVTAPTNKATARIQEGLEVEGPGGEIVQTQPIDVQNQVRTKRLKEGSIQIGTLHKFLLYNSVTYNLPKPHPSIIIVDEMSMTDTEAMYYLSRYVESCIDADIPVILFFTGDVEQLPAVGAGAPYRDILGTKAGALIPATTLNTVYRQGKSSAIIESSQMILRGEVPLYPAEVENDPDLVNDFHWEDYSDKYVDVFNHLWDVADRATDVLGEEYYPEDVQLILSLRNQPATDEPEMYLNRINPYLQKRFAEEWGTNLYDYEAQSQNDEDTFYQKTFGVGDPVVHRGPTNYLMTGITKNQQGIVSATPEKGVVVDFDGQEVEYFGPKNIGFLQLVYAQTVHVAQGSEFEIAAVVVPHTAGYMLMHRSWLYTAITRASKFCNVMATDGRMELCVSTNRNNQQQTVLSNCVL